MGGVGGLAVEKDMHSTKGTLSAKLQVSLGLGTEDGARCLPLRRDSEMTHWSQFPELRPFIRFSKHPPTGAFSLCPGSGLNEPRIYLQPSDPGVSMQMTVFCGECQWQLDHFLICIPKASRLSGNTSHRQSGGGYF